MHLTSRFRSADLIGWRLFALMLVATVVAVPASGSTFVTMDLNELVAESESAVEGRVVAVQSYWNKQQTAIVTDVTIAVDEKLFGRAGGELVVRTFGGTVDGYTIEAIGFPQFQEDERVLLFVHRPETPDGKLRVTGYQLGHYRIVRQGDEDAAIPAIDDGARFLSPSGKRATPPSARSLEQLKDEIRSAANSQRKGDR